MVYDDLSENAVPLQTEDRMLSAMEKHMLTRCPGIVLAVLFIWAELPDT